MGTIIFAVLLFIVGLAGCAGQLYLLFKLWELAAHTDSGLALGYVGAMFVINVFSATLASFLIKLIRVGDK
jgi:hypothetical protein